MLNLDLCEITVKIEDDIHHYMDLCLYILLEGLLVHDKEVWQIQLGALHKTGNGTK